MATAIERFLEAARQAGVRVAPVRFPQGTRTAVDAAAAVGCDVGQIVKSLVFVADERPVLALVSGRHRVDETRLAAAVGASSVRKASADEVRTATGYAIGGAPPFGHPAPLRTLIDPALLAYTQVWAAAGTPRDVFPLDPARLTRITGGEVVDLGATT